MAIYGVDISSHQPTEQWDVMKQAGVSFAAVKLCGGTTYANEYHDAQAQGARDEQILVIHYGYGLEPTGDPSNGEAEGRVFVARLVAAGGLRDGEGVALDLEEGGGNLAEWALAWLTTVEALTGVAPFLYTYPSFLDEHGLHDPRLARFPLWLASYRETEPPAPAPWRTIAAWQYSDNEDIPGVGHVDGDRFDGTLADLAALGKRPATASPAAIVAGALAVAHPVGFLAPGTPDTFAWGEDAAGVIVYRMVRYYNPDERAWYEREWSAESGFTPWVRTVAS